MSAVAEIVAATEAEKERKSRRENWITEGIVVKIKAKSLGPDFYKQKGRVVKTVDKFVAEIELNESKTLVRVDQAELETVIPKPGGRVLIVNGAYRGATAEVRTKSCAVSCRLYALACCYSPPSMAYDESFSFLDGFSIP